MKQGIFKLLRKRGLTEKIDVEDFESRNAFKIPDLYRAFIQTFFLEKDNTFNLEKFLNPTSDRYNGFMVQNYESLYTQAEITVGSLYSLDETIENMKLIYPQGDEIWNMGLLAIGENDSNESFLLGLHEIDKDKIFLERTGLTPRLILIAENIFEFAKGISMIPQESYLGGYKLSQLYKNWGEDFWRIREE